MNDMVREFLTMYLRVEFPEDELFEKVVPDYPPIAKRILRDNGIWAKTFRRENVSLVTDRIESVTASGVRMADGTEHDFDVIIYGTGFQASRFLMPMRVFGREGADLHQRWDGDARAYLGVVVPGFPNLFMCYGPNTNIVINGSIIYFSELEVGYMVDCLRMALERGSQDARLQTGRLRRLQRGDRRGEPRDGVGSVRGQRLVQERARTCHPELALLAPRVLAAHAGAEPGRLRPALGTWLAGETQARTGSSERIRLRTGVGSGPSSRDDPVPGTVARPLLCVNDALVVSESVGGSCSDMMRLPHVRAGTHVRTRRGSRSSQIAGRQHLVFTAEQGVRCRYVVRARSNATLRTDDLVRLYRGIYRLGGRRDRLAQQADTDAWLACGTAVGPVVRNRVRRSGPSRTTSTSPMSRFRGLAGARTTASGSTRSERLDAVSDIWASG